jgi:hypothetical protein
MHVQRQRMGTDWVHMTTSSGVHHFKLKKTKNKEKWRKWWKVANIK